LESSKLKIISTLLSILFTFCPPGPEDLENRHLISFDGITNEYQYQVIPFANYDTDEIDSYMEITFPDYDNPVVILYDGSRQIRLYEGTSNNEFNVEDLDRILYK